MIGAVLTLVAVAGGVAATRRVRKSETPEWREQGRVSLILVPAGGPVGRAVDRLSGGHGFAHIGIDTLERNAQGEHLGIDCHVGQGTSRRRLFEITSGMRVVRIVLPEEDGEQLYACARARIGTSYSLPGLVRDQRFTASSYQCAQLVYECLPHPYHNVIRRGHVVSPNDFARAYGVTPSSEDVVL